MRWWLGARRAWGFGGAAVLAFALLVFAVQNTRVVLPSLVGSPQIALTLFVPVPLIACLTYVLSSRAPAPEDSGVRAIGWYDAVLTTVIALAALGCALLLTALGGTQEAAAAGRNVFFLVGLTLVGRALFGPSAVLLPVGWLVLVVGVGFRADVPRLWTVVPQPAHDVPAALASALVFLLGLATLILAPKGTP
ncbi:hypothetical protein GA0115251_130238 [Streptomyces sp. TverLS-915]|uniref:hypothetical protein n=1 Tax=Streptomyces sp. TverLS-915 TaxID=1839763 RepID=UPI00081D9D3A|nr:hypothetical protein [Streptomyces sp. TverLS-915]SCD94663.1 hypothetical protein GA0115251_130238 [Streptomyces sp. TverLS-915]